MAQSSARRTLSQNLLFGNKVELPDAALTKGNNALAVSCVHTPALVLAPNTVDQVLKYTNNDLQKSIKLALKLFRQGQQHQPLSKS